MEALKSQLLAKGGTLSDWGGLITNGLQAEDQLWVESKNWRGSIMEYARRVMSKDAILEYECYDSRGRPQGNAVVRLLDWEDFSRGILRAQHLAASDQYYQWYAEQELTDEKGIYHVCQSARKDCSERLGRGDRRELVHLHRWRMTSPLVMMESGYTKPIALRAMQNWVNNFEAVVPEPPNPPKAPVVGAGGNDPLGLDKEMAAAEKEDAPEGPAMKKPKKKEETVDKRPRGSVGEVLERKAAARREALREKEVERKRSRKKPRSRSRGRRRGRRSDRTSSGERSGSTSRTSRSSQGFQRPSSGGEAELWRQSQKHPGSLLKQAMKEMGRYLAARVTGEDQEEDWTGRRMMAYLNQVVLVQHPPGVMGVRNHRELTTLGRAIDLLLQGHL